jgi:glycerol-3-phosphate acyltransferase PlsX
MSAPDALSTVRIAVDCMGGDHGPAVTLPACRAFLDRHPGAELLLVGRPDALAQAAAWPRCTIVAASEVVAMDDPVEVALRRKKNSSMRVAIAQLKPGGDAPAAAHACVSAGNTGALMALARYLLKTLDGIDRPAIATVMPNRKDGYTTVLDLGANVDCTAEHLLQFAVMGSALVAAVEHREDPSVGLLNIGEEAIKGSETIKRAGELLRDAASHGHLNFYGNVEGNDIFKGTTDIVVCDGFVGNVLLKTSEGLASMLTDFIRQEFTRNAWTRLAAVVALPVLKHFKHRLDPRRYNGAALLGLRGLVFKSHGSADAYAFEQALNRACEAARNRLLDRVHDRILETLQAMPAPSADEPAAQAA